MKNRDLQTKLASAAIALTALKEVGPMPELSELNSGEHKKIVGTINYISNRIKYNRNSLCRCGSGKKTKKCCGEYSYAQR